MAGNACYNSEFLFSKVTIDIFWCFVGQATTFSVGNKNVRDMFSVPYLKWTLRTNVKEALACSACCRGLVSVMSNISFVFSICLCCVLILFLQCWVRWRLGLPAPFYHWLHPSPVLDLRVSPITLLHLECSSGKFLCNWLFIQPFRTLLTNKEWTVLW